MTKLDEIIITKCETEFVAKHKDYDVIGVGGNEFEAVLELSKALGALMFSKDFKAQKEHELLGLYKTLSNLLYEGDYGSLIQTGEIQKTIEKLEKELGEMK